MTETEKNGIAPQGQGLTRREVLQSTGLGTLALGTGVLGSAVGLADSARAKAASAKADGGPYNILFIVIDQERYFHSGEHPAEAGCRVLAVK